MAVRYLVTAEEMRRYDANTIEKIGIPGMVLMERAALSVLDYIMELSGRRTAGDGQTQPAVRQRILIMAGVGNNGGDGLALARLLAERGIPVDVWRVGDEAGASAQWIQQRDILRNYDVEVCGNLPAREYTILADALFGVGITRDVTGIYAEAIEAFNRKDGCKLALDMPSGIDCDTGAVRGCAVRADATVTFGFAKRGLYLYPGKRYSGKIVVADIGITEKSFLGRMPEMFCYPSAACAMPPRDAAGNKGSFGKVLLIAGEKGMAGAAVLAARAAYRAGAGMVKVLTAQENRNILQEAVPEALYGTFEQTAESLGWADVIAAGPGLGKGAAAKQAIETVIRMSGKPLLIDADGLNLLAEDAALQQELAAQDRDTVLTPHVGELARLLGREAPKMKEMLWTHGMELAEKLHAVVAAKDARTFVCQEGRPVCMNILGGSGMATAGSGDVLAGVLAGLIGQYAKLGAGREQSVEEEAAYSVYEAVCRGVLLHAAAGDLAAGAKGEYGCMAGDIAEAVAEASRLAADRSGGE